VESDGYLEMMTEFLSRVHAQIETVKAERDKITVPLPPFTRCRSFRGEDFYPRIQRSQGQIDLSFGRPDSALQRFIYEVSIGEELHIKKERDGHDSLGAEWVDLVCVSEYMLSPFARKALLHHISR